MSNVAHIVILLSLAGFVRALAQEDPGAMAVPVMDRAFFTIEIKSKVPPPAPSKNSASAPKPAKLINVIRFDSIQQNITTLSDGARLENWLSGNLIVMRHPLGWLNTLRLDSFRFKSTVLFITTRDFFNWVRPTTFLSRQVLRGNPANVFERKESGDKVWIDPKSGLPLEYDEADDTYIFTFGIPPTSAPKMPAEYKSALDTYSQMAASAQ